MNITPVSRAVRLVGLSLALAALAPGCGRGAKFQSADLFVDWTESQKRAAGVAAADAMTARFCASLNPEQLDLRVYHSADPNGGPPQGKAIYSNHKQLLPKQEQAAKAEIASVVSNELAILRQSPPVVGQSRILEDIYAIVRANGVDNRSRWLIVISDLEEYSPTLRTSQIVTANEDQRKALLDQVVKAYPPPAAAPAKATLIVTVSDEGYKSLSPARHQALEQFFVSLLKRWGVADVELLTP